MSLSPNTQAIVVATHQVTTRGRLQPLANVRVGGISLLKRALLTLAKEGIQSFAVVYADEAVEEQARQDDKLAALDIRWVQNASRASEDGFSVLEALPNVQDPYLVVPCDRVFDGQIVRTLLQQSSGSMTLAVSGDARKPLAEAGLSRIGEYGGRIVRTDAHSGFTGLFVANRELGRALQAAQVDGRPLRLDRILSEVPAHRMHEVDVGTAFFESAAQPAGRERADQHLLASLRKDVDGLVARHVNRVFSLAVTRLIKNTPIRPNHVTAFSLGISIFAAFAAAHASSDAPWWLFLGAVLWQLASMLDGVDGELARLKFAGSKLGEWFDTLTDDIGKFAFFVGSGIGASAVYGNSMWTGLAVVTVAIQITLSIRIYRKLLGAGSGSHYALTWDTSDKPPTAWSKFTSRFEFLSRRDSFVAIWMVLTAAGLVRLNLVLTGIVTLFVLANEIMVPRQARQGFVPTQRHNSLPPS
jgi:CDP-L-myo-inositol myo-inositolphosphotransferase